MLKLSKKWWYAVKAMIYIANSDKELVHISDISKDEEISESMLRRIISDLEKTGILNTVKWRYGWIKLWKTTNKISTYDILNSIWEELWITDCTRGDYCDKTEICSTTQLFWSLQTGFNSLLKMYTLDKIIKNS
jgi:Rrf2 family protein